jgi:quercetin dioxygenase-like cupin family protein
MNKKEINILETLDTLVSNKAMGVLLNKIAEQTEQKLDRNPDSPMAWEPLSLNIYGSNLPGVIRSSWLFAIRAQNITGKERHPNSHQHMMSYRGSGNLQVWDGKRWHSHNLISDGVTQLKERWVSIPMNTWHQAIAAKENWIVISFHTVSVDDLIEERPDAANIELVHQKRYVDEL